MPDRKKMFKGYKTIIKSSKPSKGYIRISDSSQDEDSQMEILEKYFPDLDYENIEIQEEKGSVSIKKRFRKIGDNEVVGATHPDRPTKTDNSRDISGMVKFFRDKNLRLTFPHVEELVEAAEKFWADPSVDDFCEMVSLRMIHYSNFNAETNTLTKEQEKLVRAVCRKLKSDRARNRSRWNKDHLFWAFYGYMGHAVNQAINVPGAKAREKSDNTFGKEPRQIKLLAGMEDYWDDDPGLTLKEMARKLNTHRGLTTEAGTQYKTSYLSDVKNNRLGAYRDLNPEIEKVLDWTRKHKPKSKRKKVQPKNSRIKAAMEEAGFKSLYKPQNEALKKLLKGTPVILQDRSGGGKNEIPIMWHMITGNPVVAVIPTLALAENYAARLRLFKRFKKGEVGVYNSKTRSRHATLLKLLERGELRFLLTTPEQMAKEELMAAIRSNREGLLFFDECHNISFSGLTYRPEYRIRDIGKIVSALENYDCLFASATVDNRTRDGIMKIRDCEYISGSLSRPNLKLFRWEFETFGQKLSAVHKLLVKMKSRGLKKGIIYFNTIDSGLLKIEEKFKELGHNCRVYFGKKKEGWNWAVKRKNILDFAKSKSMIMLATCSFGEGLNFKNVQFVICFDMPGSLEELYQWVGRAGRNDENAPVFLMDDYQSKLTRKHIIDSDKNSDRVRRFQWEHYNTLLEFLEDNPQPSMENLVAELE